MNPDVFRSEDMRRGMLIEVQRRTATVWSTSPAALRRNP